jgi:hypothetical protein
MEFYRKVLEIIHIEEIRLRWYGHIFRMIKETKPQI